MRRFQWETCCNSYNYPRVAFNSRCWLHFNCSVICVSVNLDVLYFLLFRGLGKGGRRRSGGACQVVVAERDERMDVLEWNVSEVTVEKEGGENRGGN